MNEFKVFSEQPFFLTVINQEFTIDWNFSWLDGTQVSAYDLCGGMQVAELHSPYSSAGTNIQNMLYMMSNRRTVELPI